MDGVLWRGAEVLPGVPEFFARLRRLGIPFAFATNNSGKLPEAYAARLREIGVEAAAASQVVTSGAVTAEVLADEYPPGTLVHVLGSPALVQVLRGAGFAVTGAASGFAASGAASSGASTSGQVAAVVVGIDLELTYDKLAAAARHIAEGAAFYGTNGDVSLPTAVGMAPGTGSILAALEAATGVAPVVMGKPERHMYASASERLGADPERTLMIGDRLDTDILGAKRCGMPTALVLTGVEGAAAAAGAARADAAADGVSPDGTLADGTLADGVFADLPSLSRALAAALGEI